MPKKTALRKGSVAEIRFLDHVEDDHTPHKCVVYGRVAKVSKTHYVIESWCYPNDVGEPGDPNVKSFTILRSTILSQRRLAYA